MLQKIMDGNSECIGKTGHDTQSLDRITIPNIIVPVDDVIYLKEARQNLAVPVFHTRIQIKIARQCDSKLIALQVILPGKPFCRAKKLGPDQELLAKLVR